MHMSLRDFRRVQEVVLWLITRTPGCIDGTEYFTHEPWTRSVVTSSNSQPQTS